MLSTSSGHHRAGRGCLELSTEGYAPGLLVRKERSDYYSIRCHRARPMQVLEIDDYILDTLMRRLVGHDRQPSAYLVYLLLWRLSHGKGRPRVQLALTDM